MSEVYVECPQCDGTGTDLDPLEECSLCLGTGEVLIEEGSDGTNS